MDNFIISRSFSELSDSTFYTRDAPGLDWFAMDMGITGDVVCLRAVDMDTKEVLAIVLIYIEMDDDGNYYISKLEDGRIDSVPAGLIEQGEIIIRSHIVDIYREPGYADWMDAGYTTMVELCDSRIHFSNPATFNEDGNLRKTRITEFPVYAVTYNALGSRFLGPIVLYFNAKTDGACEFLGLDVLTFGYDKMLWPSK